MSIRYKILAGCLSLTLLTVTLGAMTHQAERALGEVATRIYDQALMALSYLRSSQNGLITLRADLQEWELKHAGAAPGIAETRKLLDTALPGIQDDLEVARARAMSPAGQEATASLGARIDAIRRGSASGTSELFVQLDELQRAFDTTVEVYAGDGFRYRRSVGEIIDRTLRNTLLAVIASILVALFITYLLSRSIVPAIREAASLAQAIAGGKLDNVIKERGRGEAAQLLAALAVMQRSISSHLGRITALMADQRASHASQMGEQNARFEAALNNMSQGLCMFDARGRLSIHNQRFTEMFGEPAPGAAAATILGQNIGVPIDADQKLSLCDLPDGRTIAVTSEPMGAGGWVSTFEDVTERRAVEERLSFMARHDALTGLPNRTLFQEYMERVCREGGHLAVLCLDIDKFKTVNDTLGHPIGDGLLCAVADRLRGATLKTDLVVRLGGDEFAIVRTGDHGPEAIADLAGAVVEGMALPFVIDSHQIVVSASVGAALSAAGPLEADRLLKNADMALYRAKAEGRSTFRFFEPEMDARLQARRALELDLRGAMTLGQFELFYQPLVDTGSCRVIAFEALLRWRHPERGLVPPGLFIPLAEEIGLIEDIGAWVLDTACRQATSWPDHIKVAVNLSPIQFRNRLLAARVAESLANSGLSPTRLELEITESVLLNDSAAVLTILDELKLLGVSIAMDDFGTGYSSLSYLHKFPFDKIKIDRCFISGLEHDDGIAIVRAVIGLGRSLNLTVTAEGVETAEQLHALQREGCSQAQGYYFSKPRPASELTLLIAEVALGVSDTSSKGQIRSPETGVRPQVASAA